MPARADTLTARQVAPTLPALTAADVLHAYEVAALLRVPLSTVMQWARLGQIPAHKRGRRWLFLRSEIDAWLRA